MTILIITKTQSLSDDLIYAFTNQLSTSEDSFTTTTPFQPQKSWKDWFNNINIDLSTVTAVLLPLFTSCRSNMDMEIGLLLDRLKNLNTNHTPILIFNVFKSSSTGIFSPESSSRILGRDIHYVKWDNTQGFTDPQLKTIRQIVALPAHQDQFELAVSSSFSR